MITKLALMGIALILTASLVWGSEEVGAFKAGDYTLTLGGGGNSDKDLDNSILSFNVGLSNFITDQTAVAARQELNFADAGSNQSWNGSTRFALDYHWTFGNCRPFAGANIGYLYGDNVEEQFIAGPEFGLKHFIEESAFIYLNAEYQFLFKDTDQANNSLDDGRFVYGIGLGFRW